MIMRCDKIISLFGEIPPVITQIYTTKISNVCPKLLAISGKFG